MDLTNYAKYGISLLTSQNEGVGYYMVTITYGKKWAVQMPTEKHEQNVRCAKIKEDGTYCYMTEMSNGLEPIFGLIDETIIYNEELEKKVDLLKVKAEELKDIFAFHTYDELLMLKFVIEKPQEPSAQKNKRPTKSGKKTQQKPNMAPTEEKYETVPETEAIPIVKTEPNISEEPKRMDGVSEIDKKIAEAINNKK